MMMERNVMTASENHLFPKTKKDRFYQYESHRTVRQERREIVPLEGLILVWSESSNTDSKR